MSAPITGSTRAPTRPLWTVSLPWAPGICSIVACPCSELTLMHAVSRPPTASSNITETSSRCVSALPSDDSGTIPTVSLLGLDFADLPLGAVTGWLAARPPEAAFGYVVTPNADHLVRMQRLPGLRPLYTDAMLRLLDSRVVAAAAWVAGLPAPTVVPGSDLTADLVQKIIDPAEPITILGMESDAVAILSRRWGLRSVAH